MVGLLGVAAALEEQQQRLVPGRLAGAHHGVDARADVGPDLRPHLARRAGRAPTGTSRRACRGGRRRCRRTSGPGPTPSTSRSATSAGCRHGRARLRRPAVERADAGRCPVDGEQVAPDLAAGPQHVGRAAALDGHADEEGSAGCGIGPCESAARERSANARGSYAQRGRRAAPGTRCPRRRNRPSTVHRNDAPAGRAALLGRLPVASAGAGRPARGDGATLGLDPGARRGARGRHRRRRAGASASSARRRSASTAPTSTRPATASRSGLTCRVYRLRDGRVSPVPGPRRPARRARTAMTRSTA